MKSFNIIDEHNSEIVATIEAKNGCSALKKFRERLFSSGMTEIHKTIKGNFEMTTTYGAYFYAYEKKGN